MRSTVNIDVISACEMNLRLSGVSLQDSNPSDYENRQHLRGIDQFTQVLQGKTMSFAYNDGRIESVCPQSDDEVWAANIRRGIISSFQNTMNRLQGVAKTDETDVTGECPVKYEVLSSNTQTIRVKKTKDLMACSNRHDAQTIFKGTPYDVNSDVQSVPLMMSKHVCEQMIDTRSRLVTMTTCTESHAFRPFAKWNSGATTDITYKLTFRRQYANSQQSYSTRRVRSSLLFDHTLSAEQTDANARDVLTTFQQLCEKSQPDIRPDAPGLFTKLVHQMKKLDSQSLRQLAASIRTTCSKAEKFYRDALPLLGTSAGLSTMNQMIRSQQVTERELTIWISSVSFYKNPTPELMTELRELLVNNKPKSSLAVSAVVNAFCTSQGDEQCSTNQRVADIMRTFEDELQYNCRGAQTADQIEAMLTALRAIGNAGLAARSAVTTLTRCASNDAAQMSIRVAAINAFRRVKCTTNDRSDLFSLLENRQADSELRINAYLAVMQCASADTLVRVQRVLESDEINQVLSFVWTHLTNMRETSSPLKQGIRAILENTQLKKEFDMDKRKFSRNIELSAFSELANVGGSLDINTIFSGESFVPRSAAVNFTVDMFGKSVNLLEIGGRVQGIEDLLEQLMGPGSDVDNSIRRQRRAPVRDELLNRIDRTFNKQPDSDQLSYYLRLFGNEIKAGDIFSFDLEAIKNKFNFLDWLVELAKDHNIDVTKNFHFLDATVVIPTGTGMPIKLNAEGSATVGLTARGKVDVRHILSTPSVFDVSGSVRPSAALEIDASMGVDAVVASTGLKLVNTLHSSTVLDGQIQLRDGRVFNFDWNLPQNKVEIFNAESHVYVTYRGEDREQSTPSDQLFNWQKCTNRELAQKAGLQLCAELSVPKASSGALGPAVGRIYLDKLDTYRGLHFEASYVHSESANSHTVRLSFNTPESRVDRELTTEFILKRPERQIQLNIKTPWKKINIDGQCIINDDYKKATLSMLLDDRHQYSISSELQIADGRRRGEKTYSPKLEIVRPGSQNIVLDGMISISDRKYDVRLALKNAFSEPITTDGYININEKRMSTKYDVSMQIGAPQFKGNLTGYTSRLTDGMMRTWSSRAVMVYTYRGGHREQFVINHKLRDQSVSNLNTYSSDCSWTSTLWPQYNGQSSIELQYSANSVRTKFDCGLDDIRKVTIVTSGAYDFVGIDKKFNGYAQLLVPYKDWSYDLKVDHSNNWESLETSAVAHYGGHRSQQTVSADVNLRKEGERPLSVVGSANLRFPGRELRISETLTERAPREYANNMVLQWQSGERITIESTYKMHPRHEFTTNIESYGLRTPITISGHLLPNPRNAQARAEVGYDGKTYLVDGNFVARGSDQQFNARASGQVMYAGQGATAAAEMNRRDREIGASVEVTTTANRRYTASSAITASMTAPRLQTRVEWPGRNFVEIVGTGRYEDRASDVEGRVKMTSSVEPIQIIEIGVVHDKNYRGGIKTNADITWAPSKKITGELTAGRSQAAVALTTPFDGYRSISGDLSYSRSGLSGQLDSSVQWDGGRRMTLNMQGDINQPDRRVMGKVAVTTPFQGYESIAANVEHTIDGSTHSTNADLTFAPRKQIALTMRMNHRRSGYYINNSGELTLTTPFDFMRTTRSNWQHQNTPNTFRSRHTSVTDGRPFGIDVDLSHNPTPYSRQISGRITFTVPDGVADWLQNGSATLSYQHEMRAIRSVGTGQLVYGRHQFGYEHDVNIDPSSTVLAKVKLTTPYASVREIGLGLNNRLHGSGWTANNELVMGSHGRIGLDGNYNRNGYSINAGVSLTTPYSGMERLSGSLRNQKQRDGVWNSHADLQYSGKQVSVDGKLGVDSPQKIVEINIQSPYEYVQQVRASAGYTGSARNFQASAEVAHNKLADKIAASMTADTSNTDNMNVLLTVSSPFREMSLLSVGGRHVRDSPYHSTSTANWQLNRHRGSALADLRRLQGPTEIDGRFEIEYRPGQKIELTTSLQTRPKIVATATLKTPFDDVRLFTASFNQEGSLENLRVSAEISHNDVNRYTSFVEAAVGRDSIRSSFRLSTPHRQVSSVSATFNVAGNPGKFSADAAIQLNNRGIAKTLNFEVNARRPSLTITGTLDTPFDEARRLSYSISHNGPASEFNNNLQFTLNGAETTASSEFRLSGPNVKFDLRTPYPAVSQLSFSHTTKPGRSFAGWQNTASARIGRQTYTAGSEMGWRGQELRVNAEVRIPEEYSINLVHNAESASNFNSELIIKMDDKQIKKSASLQLGPYNSIDFNASAETPFEGFEHWSATFKNQPVPPAGYRAQASITTPLRAFPRASADFTFSKTDRDGLATSLTVDLPFEAVRRLQASLNHRGTIEDMSSDVSVSVDRRTVTGALTYKNNDRLTEGSINVQSPFAELSRFNTDFRFSGRASNFVTSGNVAYTSNALPDIGSPSFRLEHTGDSLRSLRTSGEMTTRSGRHSMTFEHNGDSSNFRSHVKVTTPNYVTDSVGQEEAYEATIEHRGQAGTTSVALSGPASYGLTISKTGSSADLQLNGEVHTPIRGWARTALTASHRYDRSRASLECRAELETSQRGLERIVAGLTHAGDSISNFQTNAYLETSKPGYQRMSASVNNAADSRQVRTGAAVETTIPGYNKFAVNSELSMRSPRSPMTWTLNGETPFRGYERWSSSVEHTPSSRDDGGFTTSIQLTTPVRGYEAFSATVTHAGNSPNQFQTTFQIRTPFREAPVIDVTVRHRGYAITDFSTGVVISYGENKNVETSASFQASRGMFEGGAKLATTVCPYFQNFELRASHDRSRQDTKSGALMVMVNNDKKVDLDYSYSTSGERNVNINIRSPKSISTELTVNNDGQGSAVVNWDRSQMRFDFGLKNIVNPSLTDRYLSFRATVPTYQRTVGFGAGYTLAADRASSRGELYWDRDAHPDFAYEIAGTVTNSPRGEPIGFDGKFKVSSALFNTDSTLTHRSLYGGKRLNTELVIDAREKLTIRSDLNMVDIDGYRLTLTAQHPRLREDVVLTKEQNGNILRTVLKYDGHMWTLERTYRMESTPNGPRYTMTHRLTHPSSRLDVLFTTVLTKSISDGFSNLSMDIQYFMSRENQMKTLGSFGYLYNKARKEFALSVGTPIDTMTISTTNREIDYESGIFRYDVEVRCLHDSFSTSIDFSRPERSLRIKLHDRPDSYVELFGQALSPTQSSIELSYTSGSDKMTYVQLSTGYSEHERLITGRSFINPRTSNDIQTSLNQLRDKIAAVRQRIVADKEQFQRSLDYDSRMKSHLMNRAVVEPFNNVVEYYSNELSDKGSQISQAFNEKYRRNEFYLRDIHQALERYIDDISRRTAHIRQALSEWAEKMGQTFDDMLESVREWCVKHKQYWDDYWRQVAAKWREMQPNFEHIRPHLDRLVEAAKQKLNEIYEKMISGEWYRELMRKIEEFKASKYYVPPSQWRQRLEQYAARIDAWLSEVLNKPEVHYARDWLARAIENNNWLYKFLGLEEQVNELIASLRSLTWETLKTKIVEFANEYLQLEKTKWTVWDPRRGEYAFQIYVPFDMPDADMLKRIDPRPIISQTKNWIQRQLPDADTSMIDIMYAYKPPSDVRDWIPPFKSHASLFGAQHYMTFDKRFFEFAGDCSFLLARDFIDGTFSVVVNYDRPSGRSTAPVKKSMTVIAGGRQVEIFPDARVTVDGTRVEMPVRVGNATVRRHGNLISVEDDWRGVDVTCDLSHDHCTLSVSGWYYGKTAGLFGTYDNEPSNDWMNADRSMTDRPELSADSWSVGRRCRPINRAVTVLPEPHTRRYRACAQLFENDRSPFRSCFRQVNASAFMTMCLNDVPQDDNSLEAETDVCSTAAAYVHECRRREVHIRMPRECIRCEVDAETPTVFHELETVRLDSDDKLPSAADVVFVVQHAACNRDILTRVAGLADNIDKAMSAEGIDDVRYAVVGFGGRQGHLTPAHVQTMDGEIFNSANKLSWALSNFNVDPSDESDTMAALMYTAHLPFTPGASKTVILIGCETCRENKIRYSDVQRILLDNDIHLHVLVQDIIRLKSKSPKTAYIYGVDQETVYTRKDVSGDDLTGEPDLRRYIRLPKDLCVALTMDTDGSVFSARQWLDSRPPVQKQFIDVMVRTVARKAQPTSCQICECMADESLTGVSRCRSCNRPDPFYWLTPTFEDDDDDSDNDDTSSPSGVIDYTNNRPSEDVTTIRPPVRIRRPPSRRPIRRRPSRVDRRRPVRRQRYRH
jgi:hypothetical protein